MRHPFSVKRAIFFDLMLYTLIIFLLAFIVAGETAQSGSPLLITGLIAAAIALTLYTAHRVIRTVREDIAGRMNELARYSAELQALSAHLETLHKELKQRAVQIHEYSSKMSDLVLNIDSLAGGPEKGSCTAEAAQGENNRKAQ